MSLGFSLYFCIPKINRLKLYYYKKKTWIICPFQTLDEKIVQNCFREIRNATINFVCGTFTDKFRTVKTIKIWRIHFNIWSWVLHILLQILCNLNVSQHFNPDIEMIHFYHSVFKDDFFYEEFYQQCNLKT